MTLSHLKRKEDDSGSVINHHTKYDLMGKDKAKKQALLGISRISTVNDASQLTSLPHVTRA